MQNIVVLSLFDGISCGQVALERIKINVDVYFASEIDKHAIKITQKNYPNTIQLGDICNLSYKDGKLYQNNEIIFIGNIDLVMGGSPCQGFSFAGKQLNFEDPRSKLFFEFVRLLKEINPKYFLLENVKMKKESENIISKELGVRPILINSTQVSAQNRKRLYWTNIPNLTQPEDKGIYLKDIIEEGFVDKDKSFCIDANYYKGGNLEQYFKKSRRQLVFKDFMELQGIKEFIGERGNVIDLTFEKIKTLANKYRVNHVRGLDDKSRCLSTCCHSMTSTSGSGIYINGIHRNLTPLECERLQTLPDNYTEGVAKTHRFHAIGNGWTVDVICHILSFINS